MTIDNAARKMEILIRDMWLAEPRDDDSAKLYSAGAWQDLSGRDFVIKYGENWHACDFYYDHRVLIHIEEYEFWDSKALGQ